MIDEISHDGQLNHLKDLKDLSQNEEKRQWSDKKNSDILAWPWPRYQRMILTEEDKMNHKTMVIFHEIVKLIQTEW